MAFIKTIKKIYKVFKFNFSNALGPACDLARPFKNSMRKAI